MLAIFFRSAFRNLFKDKVYSFLNIAELALGLSAFLYIAAYVFHETSFDTFHTKADRTYRSVADLKLGEEVTIWTGSEIALAEAAKNDLPEVEATTRVYQVDNVRTQYREESFVAPSILFADANLLEVFDFPLLAGEPQQVLAHPFSVLLTQTAVHQYFGSEDPIGKTLLLGDQQEAYEVTGILKDVPKNSHLQFEVLATFSSVPLSKTTGHDAFSYFAENLYTYVVVQEGTDMEHFATKYDNFGMKYWASNILEATGKSVDEFEAAGNYQIHKLQPLTDVHLNAKYAGRLLTSGNRQLVVILGITGLFILIVACFNFINLSTARASLRAKEIGIKKLVGSSQSLIVLQILLETLLHCFVALALAFVLLNLSLPLLNDYSEIVIEPTFFLRPLMLLTIVLIPVLVALLAGGYPAFYMARFSVEGIVKGKFTKGRSKHRTRGMLVTFQLVVFIVLVFSTIVIRKQLHFLQQQNPGFDKENVLIVKNAYRLAQDRTPFKNELLAHPPVLAAAYSSTVPSVPVDADDSYSRKGSDKIVLMSSMYTDFDFQKTFKVEMKYGRYFSDVFQTERQNVVINEAAARRLGIDSVDDAYIRANYSEQEMRVIGIMKDFHLSSLREHPTPIVLFLTDQSDYLSIRLQPGQLTQTLETVQDQWEEANTEPFDYFFLDKAFDAQYKSESRLGKVIGLFTLLAILIACFGLFGLASYAAHRKRKEIGIRKVNGARVTDIVRLLNQDFIIWIGVAFVIAVPTAYYAMQQWLTNFAYRTELSGWIIVVTGITAFVITLITISWQSYQAANSNPVDILRYE